MEMEGLLYQPLGSVSNHRRAQSSLQAHPQTAARGWVLAMKIELEMFSIYLPALLQDLSEFPRFSYALPRCKAQDCTSSLSLRPAFSDPLPFSD